MRFEGYFGSHVWKELSHRLLDMQGTRHGPEMDEHGIEMMILSLNAPADSSDP